MPKSKLITKPGYFVLRDKSIVKFDVVRFHPNDLHDL